MAAQLREHHHHFLLTGGRDPSRGAGVLLHVFLIRLETAIGPPRDTSRFGIDALQVVADLLHRVPEAIDIPAVEPDFALRRLCIVVIPQPGSQLFDLTVRPPTGRPAVDAVRYG